MPAKQNDGRIALAMLVAQQPIYCAWGSGDPAWDDTPEPEPVDATGLVAEFGRRVATEVAYVLPDPLGGIEIPGGRFARSEVPTNYLYIRTTFNFDESVGEQVRETGLFIGTVPKAGLPPGQLFLTPDQIDDPGRLMILSRAHNFIRNGSTRDGFDYVIAF